MTIFRKRYKLTDASDVYGPLTDATSAYVNALHISNGKITRLYVDLSERSIERLKGSVSKLNTTITLKQ